MLLSSPAEIFAVERGFIRNVSYQLLLPTYLLHIFHGLFFFPKKIQARTARYACMFKDNFSLISPSRLRVKTIHFTSQSHRPRERERRFRKFIFLTPANSFAAAAVCERLLLVLLLLLSVLALCMQNSQSLFFPARAREECGKCRVSPVVCLQPSMKFRYLLPAGQKVR